MYTDIEDEDVSLRLFICLYIKLFIILYNVGVVTHTVQTNNVMTIIQFPIIYKNIMHVIGVMSRILDQIVKMTSLMKGLVMFTSFRWIISVITPYWVKM